MTIHRIGARLRGAHVRHRCDLPGVWESGLVKRDLFECPVCGWWYSVAVSRGEYSGMLYWRRISRRRALRRLALAHALIPPIDNSSHV